MWREQNAIRRFPPPQSTVGAKLSLWGAALLPSRTMPLALRTNSIKAIRIAQISMWTLCLFAIGACDNADDKQPDISEDSVSELCQKYCETEVACADLSRQDLIDECEQGCQELRNSAGEQSIACADATTAVLSCAEVLSCSDFSAWQLGLPADSTSYPCQSQDQQSSQACPDFDLGFRCGDGNLLSEDQLCNGQSDCTDGADEQSDAGCFTCNDGAVLPSHQVCDGVWDCTESEDESENVCFRCNDGESIPQDWVCDGEADCPDNSDESEC